MTNQLSTQNFVAVALLIDGSHHWLTERTYNQILSAQKDEFIRPDPEKLTMFRVSGISEILSVADYRDQHPEKTGYSYGQPPSNVKYLESAHSGKSLTESMEEYVKLHPENGAVQKFWNQFKAWKKGHTHGTAK